MDDFFQNAQEEAYRRRLTEVTYGLDGQPVNKEIAEINSYAMVKENGGGAVTAGSIFTISGTNYQYSNAAGTSTSSMPNGSVWRCMGVISVGGVSLAVRVG